MYTALIQLLTVIGSQLYIAAVVKAATPAPTPAPKNNNQHIDCDKTVNVLSNRAKVFCSDYGKSLDANYNWDLATDKTKSINYYFWTAPSANDDIDAPFNCPLPDVTSADDGTRAILTGGWSARPAALDASRAVRKIDGADNPWFVRVTIPWHENGATWPESDVKIVFSGWQDWHGSVSLCTLDISGAKAYVMDGDCAHY